MRHLVALFLVAVLVGCTTPRGRPTAVSDNSNPKPFVGSPASAPDKEAPGALTSQESGMLAGSVWLDGRPVTNATVRITSLENGERAPTRLTVKSQGDSGSFTAPGLQKGHRYQLVATARQGEQAWTGRAFATANKLTVVIRLEPNRAAPAASTSSPLPTAPAETETGPAPRVEGPPPSTAPEAPAAPPAVPFDPKRVAGTQPQPDFNALPQYPAAIGGPPSRKTRLPTPPARDEGGVTVPGDGSKPAVPLPAPPSNKRPAPKSPALVPSCVQPGNRVENFALYDFQGNRWELVERQTGKMVLLHFWSLSCPACPPSIPKLVEFQKKWGGKGLQVVSILHDENNLSWRKQSVLNIANDYKTKYNFPVLFSERNCPVRRTMKVQAYPTFILLNESGRVVHRCEGLNEINRMDLEDQLKDGLGK